MKLFIILLQLLFICLKITNYIDWNWFVVLIPLVLTIVFYVAFCILYIYAKVLEEKNNKKLKTINRRGFAAKMEDVYRKQQEKRNEQRTV